MPLTADAKRSVHIASNPVMATFPRAAHRVSTTPRSSGNLPATQSPGSLSDTAQQPPPLPSATHVKPTTSVPISRGHLNHSLGGPGQYSHSGSVTSKSSSVGGLGAERTVRPILSQSAAFAQHHPGNPGDILHQSSILSSTSNVGSNVGSNGGGNARFANKADNSLLILSSSVGGDGLTQNRGAGKARFLAQRAQLHPILLSFSHAETEADYKIFFIEKHLFVWRRTVYLLFFAATALYAYVMIRSPADGREWGRLYTDEKKAGVTEDNISQYCPPGWFCMKCNPDYICNSYSVAADLAFWLATILAPCLALICVSYKVKGQFLASHIHLLSALFILAFAAGGVILRYLIVEPMTPVFQPALICIMLIFVSYMFMRLRFIYAVVSITIIVVWFIAGYAPHVTNHPELTPSTAKTYIISVLALVVSGGVMSFNTYENEVFNRSQFLAAYTLHKTNAKLLNQLKVLQKAYGRKVADLDSPLEKSVMLIRSLMADPSNSPSHLVTMGQIMTLLASSNLMTPDLENQVGDLVDTEQEKWLFAEIAPRRKGSSRPRHGSRRRSITGDVSTKIDVPIAEGVSHASIMASAPLGNGEFSPTNGGNASDISVDKVRASGSLLGDLPHRAAGSAPDISSRSDMYASSPSVRSAQGVTKFSSLPVLNNTSNAYINDPIFAPGPEVTSLLAHVQEYNFPLFDFRDACDGRPLGALSAYLFRRADLFNAFKIPPDIFRTFIINIENGYRPDLPYHNSTHASDVLHCVNYFVHSNEHLSRAAGDVDVLSMYLSAIIHDFDHPGLNNNFLVRISDSRAIMYNDRSVLENYHLSSAWKLLTQPENNFLCNMSAGDFKGVREQVIDMVLATDLSQHFSVLTQFKSRVSSASFSPEEGKEDRWLLWKILIKLADVSNPSKDWRVYGTWVRLILEEFYMQGDVERERGMEISSFMDRNSPSIPGSQNGFIEFIVAPLFMAYDSWMPIPSIMEDLALNREFWLKRKEMGLTTVFPTHGPRGDPNAEHNFDINSRHGPMMSSRSVAASSISPHQQYVTSHASSAASPLGIANSSVVVTPSPLAFQTQLGSSITHSTSQQRLKSGSTTNVQGGT